jgi:hypothetical protein
VRNRLSLFAVNVRLGEGADRDARWQSVATALHGEAGSDVWQESASCFVLESPKSARELCDSIFGAAEIYDDRDLVVVVNLSRSSRADRDIARALALDDSPSR